MKALLRVTEAQAESVCEESEFLMIKSTSKINDFYKIPQLVK